MHKNWRRWRQYIQSSTVETVIGKDILQLAEVRVPALFKQVFDLMCQYPAQMISYNKLLEQLICYYVELFAGAYLLYCLEKFATKPIACKSSSPKLLPRCPAVAFQPSSELTPSLRGRLVELAVGLELHQLGGGEFFYWQEGDMELDYVFQYKRKLYAIEVKSSCIRKYSWIIALYEKVSNRNSTCLTARAVFG